MNNKKLVDLNGLKEYHNKLKENLDSIVDSAVESLPKLYVSDIGYNMRYNDIDLTYFTEVNETTYTTDESFFIAEFNDLNDFFYEANINYPITISRTRIEEGQEQTDFFDGIATPTNHGIATVESDNVIVTIDIVSESGIMKVTFAQKEQD